MSKPEHSPLPWRLDSDDLLPDIIDVDGDFVANGVSSDLQFMLTACNSYYENRAAIAELVEAVNEAHDLIKGELTGSAWKRACASFTSKARALIAKHKAKP